MKILIVHGMGYKEGFKESDRVWQGEWLNANQNSLNYHNINVKLEKDKNVWFSEYDSIFQHETSKREVIESIQKVIKALKDELMTKIREKFLGGFRSRSFYTPNSITESTLGMIAKWLGDDEIKKSASQKILDDIEDRQPDIILAHSLGSLICYHAFNTDRGKKLIKDRIFVSFGSQIGNPIVKREFSAGRVVNLKESKFWFHLYNENDIMFTESLASLNLPTDQFREINTEFNISEIFSPIDSLIDHDGLRYLNHENTTKDLWNDILDRLGLKPKVKSFSVDTNDYPKKPITTKQKKALLVGINEYPNPYNNLNGCVNDVFLMSQALQESGFKAENIRILLNNRATSKEIYNRLEWLTGDVRNEEERVFFYSGHGVQVPSYGYEEEVDHSIECLATYDFDYDNPDETGITDKKFREFYSNLNYNSNFTVILDCCHSGGMDRGVQGKIKGLEIPDDIRHRMQFWDAEKGWQKRIFPTYFEKGSKYFDFAGESGSCQKIGRALELRNPNEEQFKTQRDFFGHLGPYLPIIFEACQEYEPALEMKYGNQAYGAFTFSFVNTLRALRKTNIKPSLDSFLKLVGDNLRQYITGQTPKLVAPQDKRIETFRW